jgi:hypothetical protein
MEKVYKVLDESCALLFFFAYAKQFTQKAALYKPIFALSSGLLIHGVFVLRASPTKP